MYLCPVTAHFENKKENEKFLKKAHEIIICKTAIQNGGLKCVWIFMQKDSCQSYYFLVSVVRKLVLNWVWVGLGLELQKRCYKIDSF